MRRIKWVCIVIALAFTPLVSRAAALRYDLLLQSNWQPYFGFIPTNNDGGDWSVKLYDDLGTLQDEWRSGYGFNHNGLSFATLETLGPKVYTVQYKPSGSTQTSVYTLTLDLPGWSSANLLASRPTIAGPAGSKQAGQPVTITWPVYPGAGTGSVAVTSNQAPFTRLYQKAAPYDTGTLVTDGLPIGVGSIELDYSRPLAGAAARLQLTSGPATDISTDPVNFYSWQSSGFTVVPEPASTATAAAAAAAIAVALRRRQRRH